VIVTEVISRSPAEKAGVKKDDILLDLNCHPVENPETLTRLVQAARDQASPELGAAIPEDGKKE
jgi:S1-C subfamily serine protease